MTSDNLSFGEYRLDTARRELWRGDELVALPAKVFDCIAYLAEHRDRAVGRDELIAAVWGRADVTDNLLDQIMLRARRAVGDVNGERHVIRTIPRFGFSWVAPVECTQRPVSNDVPGDDNPNCVGAPHTIIAVPPTTPSPWRGPRRVNVRTLMSLGATLILLAAAGTTLWLLGSKPISNEKPLAVQQHEDLIMVLPVSVTAGSEFGWVRLGAMDLITTRLRAAGLAVVPSDNTVALARGFVSPTDRAEVDAIAKKARATLILTGHAESSPQGWRISLRTIYGSEPQLAVQGEASNVLDAARAASDRMAALLGFPVPPEGTRTAEDLDIDVLLHQSEAAILSDQFESARVLLDSANARQLALPEVRYQRALLDLYAGRPDAARSQFEALTRDVSAADDRLLHAKSLYGLGTSFLRLSDYPVADTHVSAAVELLQVMSGPTAEYQLGVTLNLRGGIRGLLGKFESARHDFAQARTLLENSGDQLMLAGLDSNIGVHNVTRNRYVEALPYFERAARIIVAFHSPTRELRTRQSLARVHLALLDPEAAFQEDEHLRELINQVADRQLKQYSILARVQVLDAVGRISQARTLLQEVRRETPQAGDELRVALSAAIAAEHALSSKQFARAAAEAGNSLKIDWKSDYPRWNARVRLIMARAQLAQGQREAAATTIDQFRAWTIGNVDEATHIYLNLAEAEQAATAGNHEAATEAFERALAEADASRVPLDLLNVCAAYGAFLIDKHDFSRATIVVDRLSSWVTQDYDAALVQLTLYHALGELNAWQAALTRTQALAGERAIPVELTAAPPSGP